MTITISRGRVLAVCLALVVGGVLGAAVSRASADPDAGKAPVDAVSVAAATVDAQAPNARLAALVDGSSTLGSFSVLRAKGVGSVTNPTDGIYCIKPARSTGIAVGRAVPTVTTEYLRTPTTDSFAQWSTDTTLCPSGRFPVRGFRINTAARENSIAFTIVVP